jgi:WD40 repeat protein
MGTVDYLSPEQARDSHEVDIRTDIYSLGATLYFLLISHPPFQGRSTGQKLTLIQLQDPEDVRQLRPEVPEGLATVLRRMMAKQPDQRYQTPQEVVAALAPWEGQPAAEGKPGAGLPVVDPVSSGQPPGSVAGDTRPEETRVSAPATKPATGAGKDRPAPKSGPKQESPPPAEPDRQERTRPSRKPVGSALSKRKPGTRSPQLARRWRVPSLLAVCLTCSGVLGLSLLWLVWRYSPGQTTLPPEASDRQFSGLIHSFPGHNRRVEAVAWSSNGAWVLSGSENGEMFLWDMKNNIHVHTFPVWPGGIWSVAFSPDGRFAVAGGVRHGICLYDLQTRQLLRTLKQENPTGVPAVAFTADSRQVVACSSPGSIQFWDLETGDPVRTLPNPAGDKEKWSCLALSPDDTHLVASSDFGSVVLYDWQAGEVVRRLTGHRHSVRRTAFSPDGRYFASCGADGQVILWDGKTGREVRRFEGHQGYVEWVGFSPDGRTLLTTEGAAGGVAGVTTDQGIRLWDVGTGEQLHRYGNVPEKVHCAAFSPYGWRVVAGCGDNLMRLYDVEWITARQP